VRRSFYVRAQSLFLGAVGTTWSVANSQFAANVIRQVAYTGFHLGEGNLAGEFEGGSDGVGSEDESAGGGSSGDDDTHHWNGTALVPGLPPLAVAFSQSPSAARWLSSSASKNSDGVFVTDTSQRAEMQWGILASFCLGCFYFGLACFSIASVSAACKMSLWSLETLGRGCSQSAYMVELSMLLQNNWYGVCGHEHPPSGQEPSSPLCFFPRYYVCGYCWELFWSYLWFGALVSGDAQQRAASGQGGGGPRAEGGWQAVFAGHAGRLFLLDCCRAALFTLTFSAVATRCLQCACPLAPRHGPATRQEALLTSVRVPGACPSTRPRT
jgi:hypothetical protein